MLHSYLLVRHLHTALMNTLVTMTYILPYIVSQCDITATIRNFRKSSSIIIFPTFFSHLFEFQN